MPARRRREYRLALPAAPPARRTGACAGLKLRPPAADAAGALAALVLDAYRGTVDYEGAGLEASLAEVNGFFGGKHGRPLLDCSVAAFRGETPVSACLVAWWTLRGCPYVASIATRADAKRGGIGRLVLAESVRRAGRTGHHEIRAVITEGNAASERLFQSLGFADLGPTSPRAKPQPGGQSA